jgi:hypothetical protein
MVTPVVSGPQGAPRNVAMVSAQIKIDDSFDGPPLPGSLVMLEWSPCLDGACSGYGPPVSAAMPLPALVRVFP